MDQRIAKKNLMEINKIPLVGYSIKAANSLRISVKYLYPLIRMKLLKLHIIMELKLSKDRQHWRKIHLQNGEHGNMQYIMLRRNMGSLTSL